MVKYIVVLAFCILAATVANAEFSKEEALQKILAAAEACKAETAAQDTDIQDLLKKAPAASHEAKCMRACLLKHFGVLDASGKFVKEVALEHAKKLANGDEMKIKTAHEVIDTCAGLSLASEHCEAAEQLETCFREQAKAHGIDHVDI